MTPDITEQLSDHISKQSVFPDEEPYTAYLEQQLEKHGFDVQRQTVEDGRDNLLAEKGSGDTTLLFYGHMDTVEVTEENWEHDPFTGTEEDGRIYGRGSSDMKAGNLAILEATKDLPENVHVKVVYGVDEENESAGSTALVNETDFLDEVDIIIVPELDERDDMDQLLYGRRGRVAIDVIINGAKAHAAVPHRGKSAAKEAARFVTGLDTIELRDDPDMGKGTLTVRTLNAEAYGLTIPNIATLRLDRHTVPEETPEYCLEQLETLAADLGLDAAISLRPRDSPYLRPYKADLDHPLVKQFTETVRERQGSVTEQYGKSVADENRLAETGIPVLSYGPLGGNEHAPDEFVEKDSLEELIATFQTYLQTIARNSG